MLRNQRDVAFLIAVLAVLSAPMLFGQIPKLPPDAPIPAEIATAKKIFISNAAAQSSMYPDTMLNGGAVRCYNQLYAGMNEWGRYEIVAAPKDADLIFKIGSCVPNFQLVIMDRETQVVLWEYSEPIQSATMAANREKNFGLAMSSIMEDVKGLAARATPMGTNGGR